MTRSAIVDLGTMSRWPVPEGAPRPPARIWRQRRRVAASVVVAALATLTVTGAAGPARPALEPHFTAPAGMFAFSHDTLYVLSWGAPAVDDDTGAPVYALESLRAYQLADGDEQWVLPLPDATDGHLRLTVFEQTPVLALAEPGTGSPRWRTTAVDHTTGQPLWNRDGSPIAGADGRLVLSDVDVPPWSDSAGEARNLTAVTMATGQVEWTRSLPDGTSHIAADGRRLIHRDGDERLSSYDLTTGQVLATVDGVGSAPRWAVAGSLVFTADNEGAVTAYDVDTLSYQWTNASLPHDAEAQACGPLLCVSTLLGRHKALDPADGSLVWTAGWLQPGGPVAIGPAVDVDDDHLLLSADIAGTPGPLGNPTWLVETHSGKPLLDLHGWYPDLIDFNTPPGANRPTVLPYYYDSEAELTWVGRLHTDPPGLEVLRSIGGPAICLAGAGHALCPGAVVFDRDEPKFQVWRLRDEGG